MDETIKNLTKAFIGESQARNRYTLYSKIAQKEGFEKIAEVFLTTAENEREHAKWIFKLINELNKKRGKILNEIKVEATASLILGNTKKNLKASIDAEHYENTIMYPEFAKIAEREGLSEIAERLKAIANAEKHHEERYNKIFKEVEGNTFFEKNNKVYWVCRKCGYIHEGKEPPERCPSCNHSRDYFELKCEEY